MWGFEDVWRASNEVFDRYHSRGRQLNEPWKIVPMGAVSKSALKRVVPGKYSQIVIALKGLKEDEAVEVATNGKKHLAMFRTEIRRVAKRSTSRRVLSSRDFHGTTLWLWLEPATSTGNIVTVDAVTSST